MSLYRKYRPQSFADVYGQDHVIATLEKSSEQGKLTHAYLFAGSRGTGKTSVARILAKIIMIQGIGDETLQRHIVRGVEDGTIVDLLEIDAASTRGIDDVRELIGKIQFSPVASSAKVYIIDEVHMLTKEAFNALLKTLEEPPPYAYFILATTELNKVPVTIQSRCQCFPFRQIREEDIIRRLQYIADQEKITINRDALRAIAHTVDGSMRDAISLLDQLRSLEKITIEDVELRIGTTGQEFIEALFLALENRDVAAVVENIRKVEETGIPMDVFARQILRIVRDSLHEAIAEKCDTAPILAMLNDLLNVVRNLRTAPVPGLVLEAALINFCNSGSETRGEKTRKEDGMAFLGGMKKKTESTDGTEKKEKGEEIEMKEIKEKEGVAGEVEAPEATLESVRDAWPQIVNDTKPASVKMSLKNGRVSAVEGDRITVSFSSSFHRDKVKGTESSRSIEELLEAVFKHHLRLYCTLEDGESAPASDDVVNVAEAAAEIF